MIKPTLLRKLPLPLIAIFSALVFSQLPSVSARQAATPEESALLAAIETSLSPFQLANRQWVVDGVHVAHPWGIGALSLFDPVTAAPIPSSPQLVLAQMVGGSWQVALPFDPQQSNLYNQWLDQIPNDLIPSENKDALRRPTANKIAPAAVVSGYKLPWPGGQQAYLTSNAADHGYPSLDFNILGSPASGDVVAAKAGTVRFTKDSSTTQCTWNGSSWSCDWKYTNVVVIEHSSSEFSWYMHLAPGSIPSGIQPGTYVSQGTKIGVEGKTGWATGVHLHFQVATSYGCCSGSGVTQTPYWPTAFHEVNFLEYSWAAMQSYGWKDSQNFLNNCPGPNLSSPSDGYVSNNQSLTFDWSGPSGCTYQGYTFRVKDTPNMDSGGTTIFDEGQGGLSVTKTFAAQWHNRDLYWGVRTANPLSPNWSVRRFRIEPGSQPPGGSWNADYYDNIDRWWDNNNGAAWQCSESINGAFLDKNYAGAAPCNGMDPESWIGDYASTYDFPTGDYVFWLEHDDGAKLWVNGQNIQDRGGSGSGWVCPPRPLSGSTALRVMLREDGGDAKIKLNWTTNTAVCITPPAPPQLVAPSDGTVFLEGDPITLSWSATGDEYYGEWWGGPAGVLNFGWQADASIPLGAQWAGYTYYWRIKARSADGESNWSPTWTFQIKPAQPTNLSASPADCSAILLSWSDNSGSEAGYKVYRDGALLATLGSNATSYLDSGLTSNTAYAYYVRAYRDGIHSLASLSANTTTPNCPTNDDIAAPAVISTAPFDIIQDTSAATEAADDPTIPNCNLTAGFATVWYSYTPSQNGTILVNTRGSEYDTVLAVWTGARGSLNPIACNDDLSLDPHDQDSELSTAVTAGVTYLIEVTTWEGALARTAASDSKPRILPQILGGNLHLHLDFTPDPIELLANRSFESSVPASWVGKLISPIADTTDCTQAHTGTCSYKMTGDADNSVLISYFPGLRPAGDNLSLSVWHQTNNAGGSGSALLRLVFIYTDETKDIFTIPFNQGTNPWQQVSLNAAAAKDYRMVTVSLIYTLSQGEIWWDDASLTINGGANLFAVKNPSFEQNVPNLWTGKLVNASTDKTDCTSAHSGSCSFTMAGNGDNSVIISYLPRSGAAGESFALSVWHRTANAGGAGAALLRLVFIYTDETKDILTAPFTQGTHGWQQVSLNAVSAKPYRMLTVSLIYTLPQGDIWWDDISLLLTP